MIRVHILLVLIGFTACSSPAPKQARYSYTRFADLDLFTLKGIDSLPPGKLERLPAVDVYGNGGQVDSLRAYLSYRRAETVVLKKQQEAFYVDRTLQQEVYGLAKKRTYLGNGQVIDYMLHEQNGKLTVDEALVYNADSGSVHQKVYAPTAIIRIDRIEELFPDFYLKNGFRYVNRDLRTRRYGKDMIAYPWYPGPYGGRQAERGTGPSFFWHYLFYYQNDLPEWAKGIPILATEHTEMDM